MSKPRSRSAQISRTPALVNGALQRHRSPRYGRAALECALVEGWIGSSHEDLPRIVSFARNWPAARECRFCVY